jgi:hypothetical protein
LLSDTHLYKNAKGMSGNQSSKSLSGASSENDTGEDGALCEEEGAEWAPGGQGVSRFRIWGEGFQRTEAQGWVMNHKVENQWVSQSEGVMGDPKREKEEAVRGDPEPLWQDHLQGLTLY